MTNEDVEKEFDIVWSGRGELLSERDSKPIEIWVDLANVVRPVGPARLRRHNNQLEFEHTADTARGGKRQYNRKVPLKGAEGEVKDDVKG